MPPTNGQCSPHTMMHHEGRIGALEEAAESAKSNHSATQAAITRLDDKISGVSTTTTATLTKVDQLLAEFATQKRKTENLEIAHASAKGAINTALGIAAVIGAGISGLITFAATHLFSGGK